MAITAVQGDTTLTNCTLIFSLARTPSSRSCLSDRMPGSNIGRGYGTIHTRIHNGVVKATASQAVILGAIGGTGIDTIPDIEIRSGYRPVTTEAQVSLAGIFQQIGRLTSMEPMTGSTGVGHP
jgi:hypothetical protein